MKNHRVHYIEQKLANSKCFRELGGYKLATSLKYAIDG